MLVAFADFLYTRALELWPTSLNRGASMKLSRSFRPPALMLTGLLLMALACNLPGSTPNVPSAPPPAAEQPTAVPKEQEEPSG